MTVKRARGRPKTVDRGAAIERALLYYWREGVHGTSLNALCGRIGLSKPGLYREFGGEDGLRRAALEAYGTKAIAPLIAVFLREQPFADALAEALAFVTERPEGLPRGCFFTLLRDAGDRAGAETRALVRRFEVERRGAFARAYARARGRGEVDQGIAPELAARVVDLQLHAVLLAMHAGDDAQELRAAAEVAFRGLMTGAR